MTALDVRWMALFADVPVESFEVAIPYWENVTGARVGDPDGDLDQYLPYEPADGDRYVWLQRVGRPVGGWHPDFYVPDLGAARSSAVDAGARVVQEGDAVIVCSSPAGQPFCLVREYRESRRRGPAAEWDSGRSAVDQICIDIPAERFADEVRFWAALTGWPLATGDHREFERLDVPVSLPLRILLQQLGSGDAEGIRAHADLSADERAAEVARQVGIGAEVVTVAEHWTVLRDVAGLIYCVTDRIPHS